MVKEVKSLGLEACVTLGSITLSQAKKLKVPHMGWNNIDAKKNHPVFPDTSEVANSL